MKIIAGWVVAFAMIAGTGTAIALSVKPQRTLAEKGCVGLGCWPDNPAPKHGSAQRTAASSQSGRIGQPELVSQASRVDRSRKADRISVGIPATAAVLPPGCEPPFSPLAKRPSSKFIARCLT